ncbi:hypothetical protein JCM10213_000714 [Rhodosporidiobolus nylandii]
MATTLNFTAIASLIPASDSTAWIVPWVERVLGEVPEGQSPYVRGEEVIHDLFFPSVVGGFKPQLWFLMGLFGLSILIVLLGLVLRLRQGRFWVLHKIDGHIVIPNISVLYGVCTLAYAALGMLTIVTAVRIADQKTFPSWWVGLQSGWILPLFIGIYCECWATYVAWYIRKKGAFYKESRTKTIVAVTLPFLLPLLAVIPPVVFFYIAAHSFNHAYSTSHKMVAELDTLNQSWTPEKGIDVVSLLGFFPLGARFGAAMVRYFQFVRAGYVYVTVVLCATFIVYIIGATLEIAHLSKTIEKLRNQARLTPRPRTPAKFSPATPHVNVKLDEQLDDEMYAGQQRQWTLLEWARRNRIYSAFAIGTMLLVNAALTAWLGATPISIEANSSQFQIEILVSAWLNGIFTTLVSALILFRSLDGSSTTVCTLRKYLPFLPLPPAISISHPSRATATIDPKGGKSTASKFEEPPKYASATGGYGRGGGVSPFMEERKTPRFVAAGGADSVSRKSDGADDEAWYGLGVTAGGREEHGVHVVLEMQEAQPEMRYVPAPPTSASASAEEAERKDEPDVEVEFEEPPRGYSGQYDQLELPYEQYSAEISEAEEGGDYRGRHDSWAAIEQDGRARRDSWE